MSGRKELSVIPAITKVEFSHYSYFVPSSMPLAGEREATLLHGETGRSWWVKLLYYLLCYFGYLPLFWQDLLLDIVDTRRNFGRICPSISLIRPLVLTEYALGYLIHPLFLRDMLGYW